MVKYVLRGALIVIIGLTFIISNLSVNKPKHFYSDQVAVVMYHHVHDTDQSSSTITTKLFRDQLTYLKSRGFHFISLDDFKSYLKGAPVPENAVLVTFDDGYQSFYQNAFPVLKQMDVPAVNFIITETLSHPQDGNVPFLSPQEIKTMTGESSLIDVQCHTDSLHAKADNGQGKALLIARLKNNGQTETEDEYKNRIVNDTQSCVRSLKDLTPRKVDSLAYPFGIYDTTASSLVQQGGMDYAFTILPKMATRDADSMKIPRINAGSPYITPEALHNMIMRRITRVDPQKPGGSVMLRDTLEQIGGELTKDKIDGSTVINYNGVQWKVNTGSRDAASRSGKITMDNPITIKDGRSYIHLSDLEKLLGFSIHLNPLTQTYTAKLPDTSEFDVEAWRTNLVP